MLNNHYKVNFRNPSSKLDIYLLLIKIIINWIAKLTYVETTNVLHYVELCYEKTQYEIIPMEPTSSKLKIIIN